MNSNVQIKDIAKIIRNRTSPYTEEDVEWIGDISDLGPELTTRYHQEEVIPVPDIQISLHSDAMPDDLSIIYFRAETDEGDLIIELILPAQQPINRFEDIDELQHIVAVYQSILNNSDGMGEVFEEAFEKLIDNAAQVVCKALNEIKSH